MNAWGCSKNGTWKVSAAGGRAGGLVMSNRIPGRINVVDMHCDTISGIYGERNRGRECNLRKNIGHIDLQSMCEGGYLLQNFALFVNMGRCENPWESVLALHAVYEEELAKNQDLIAPVYRFEDIEKNISQGKMSAMLTVEEGGVCQGDLSKLHILYEKGVRMVTLTWNYPNELGYPNLDANKEKNVMGNPVLEREYLNTADTTNGLTQTGRRFVEEMEALGMIPDVSHLSDAGFYDVLAYTKKPFVASHSNARAVCPCVRNMTDDMIRKLAERGGCMGLNYCPDFLVQKPVGVQNPGTVEDIVKQARYIANVGGIEVLGLGSDFDGIEGHEELAGAQSMEKLYDGLLKGGFTSGQVDKIFSENVLRVYKECLK